LIFLLTTILINMKRYKLIDIREGLGSFEIIGKTDDISFTNIKPIKNADENSLVFISEGKKDILSLIQTTSSKLIICEKSINLDDLLNFNKVFILVDNPRVVITRIIKKLFPKIQESRIIHASATINEEAIIDKNVSIGPNAYIGKCKIGSGVIIYGNVYIYDNVEIGKNTIIYPGSVIGAEGFGFIKNDDQKNINFPHIGGVIIGDGVEIGSNTCIDRGSLGNTVIGNGVKIDNLVHISHNVEISEDSLIIANSLIGGSTIIGKNCWIAPSSCLRDGLKIGDNVKVGMGAVVTKDIQSDQTWAGTPARELYELKQLQIIFNNLIKEA
jgi:UDP-3-O-[3-hydroxymyristoyl] glucosamine N-acyltransferase